MIRRYILLLPFLFASACLEESTTALDEKAFTRIYDNDQFDASYYPIDMQQTADGGYLMLGGRRLDNTNFSGIYLLKADRFGNFVKELEVDESFVNPIAQLMSAGTSFKFF